MKISVDTRGAEEAAVDLLAIPLSTVRGRSPKVPNGLANLDRSAGGPIRTVLANRDFSGKTGESLLVYPSSTRSRCKRILLLGLGDAKSVDAESLRKAAGRARGVTGGECVVGACAGGGAGSEEGSDEEASDEEALFAAQVGP